MPGVQNFRKTPCSYLAKPSGPDRDNCLKAPSPHFLIWDELDLVLMNRVQRIEREPSPFCSA
jgi:hypothetical protein